MTHSSAELNYTRILAELDQQIKHRLRDRPQNSYVSNLVNQGQDAVLQKVGEESTEFILATKNLAEVLDKEEGTNHPDHDALSHAVVHEMADLLFHSMVALAQLGLSMDDVLTMLKERQKPGGD